MQTGVEIAQQLRLRANPVDVEEWVLTPTGWSGVLVNAYHFDHAMV